MSNHPGFVAEHSLRPRFGAQYGGRTGASDRADLVRPAWWDIGECDMGLCLIHCYEDEGARQSVCKVYMLPF